VAARPTPASPFALLDDLHPGGFVGLAVGLVFLFRHLIRRK
jgi:hypothetical protein